MPGFVLRIAKRMCGYNELARQYGQLFASVVELKSVLATRNQALRVRVPSEFRDTSPLPTPIPPRKESAIFDPFNAEHNG